VRYAVAVGSNQGERCRTIARAAELLAEEGVYVERLSALIENPAVGGPLGQGPFRNGAWVVETGFGPFQLLQRLRRVEDRLGRQRTVRWGPRSIDLDLLLPEDGRICRSPLLELPHPRMHERDFVLQPLCEVASDWRHPILRRTVAELWQELAASAGRDPARTR